MHNHSHSHIHAPALPQQMLGRFKWSIILTVVFVAGEAFAGWWYNSLALLSDAGHNLTDGAALGISWYAIRMSSRSASEDKTFGYHRASILAALINATSLIVIAFAILYEGVHRLIEPEPVQGMAMVVVAAVAAVVNFVIVIWLRHGGSRDVNVRSAVIHMIADTLFSVGVVIAGLIVIWTGWLAADPLISLIIGVVILWSSWGILTESIHILMEGSPSHVDMEALVTTMQSVSGVQGVHDLHVWTITSGMPMLTAHVLLEDQALSDGGRVIHEVTEKLREEFGIHHTTLQAECRDCVPNDLYCTLTPSEQHHHH